MAIWTATHASAASEIAKVLENTGPDAAAAKLAEMRNAPRNCLIIKGSHYLVLENLLIQIP